MATTGSSVANFSRLSTRGSRAPMLVRSPASRRGCSKRSTRASRLPKGGFPLAYLWPKRAPRRGGHSAAAADPPGRLGTARCLRSRLLHSARRLGSRRRPVDAVPARQLGRGGAPALGRARPRRAERRPARGRSLPKPTKGLGAEHLKFNLHAGVSVPGGLPAARERLLRYCARPALALERLSVLEDAGSATASRTPSRCGS